MVFAGVVTKGLRMRPPAAAPIVQVVLFHSDLERFFVGDGAFEFRVIFVSPVECVAHGIVKLILQNKKKLCSVDAFLLSSLRFSP